MKKSKTITGKRIANKSTPYERRRIVFMVEQLKNNPDYLGLKYTTMSGIGKAMGVHISVPGKLWQNWQAGRLPPEHGGPNEWTDVLSDPTMAEHFTKWDSGQTNTEITTYQDSELITAKMTALQEENKELKISNKRLSKLNKLLVDALPDDQD